MKSILSSLFLLLFSLSTIQSQVDTMAVKSIEGITNKMLELISGDIGQERDWDQYRNLFTANAQKTLMRKTKDGKIQIRSHSIEEFIRNIGPVYSVMVLKNTP